MKGKEKKPIISWTKRKERRQTLKKPMRGETHYRSKSEAR